MQASSSPKREQLCCSLRNNRPPWESRILKSLEYHRRGKRFKHLKARSKLSLRLLVSQTYMSLKGRQPWSVRLICSEEDAATGRGCSIPFYLMFAFSGKVTRLSFKIHQKAKYKLVKNINFWKILTTADCCFTHLLMIQLISEIPHLCVCNVCIQVCVMCVVFIL